MSTPNSNFENIGFQYETTRGTKILTAAGDSYYGFGRFLKDNNLPFPSLRQAAQSFMKYSSRESSESSSVLQVPEFSITKFIPSTMQWLYLFLGDFTDASPDTLQAKDTGLKKSLTLHFEEKGGTNAEIYSPVGAYCIGFDFTLSVGEPLIVNSLDFISQSIETADYYDSNASVQLTNTPTIPQDNLPFIGINEVKWDTGGDDETLSQVARIDVSGKQNYKQAIYNHSDKRAPVYPTTYNDFYNAVFYLVLNTKNQMNDLLNQNEINVTVKSEKDDGSDYVEFLLNNLRVNNISKPIPLVGGYYQSIISASFRELSVNFDDGTSDQSNEYKE